MRKRSMLLTSLPMTLLMIATLALCLGAKAADDPMVGTWKLNVAKSKYSPGPAPQGETNVVKHYGKDGVSVVADITESDGKKVHLEYSGDGDGTPFTVKGDANSDSSTMKRVNANTLVRTSTKAGKPTTTTRYVISKDGMTKTVTITGKNAAGKAMHNVAVFEKQ